MGNKNWPHAPEALLRGRLVYNVKFYGDQEVQQAKGTEPIKEAVRKMKVSLSSAHHAQCSLFLELFQPPRN